MYQSCSVQILKVTPNNPKFSKIPPNISTHNYQQPNQEERITPKKSVSFKIDSQTQTSILDEFNFSHREEPFSNNISRSIGTQTTANNTSQTPPLVCPNCNHCLSFSQIEYNMVSFIDSEIPSYSFIHDPSSPFRSTNRSATSNISSNFLSTPLSSTRTTTDRTHHSSYHSPLSSSRYSYPSLVTSKVYTNYHHEQHVLGEYRKPLSPLNYALVKQRYKTQMKYLDKYNRNSFHLS